MTDRHGDNDQARPVVDDDEDSDQIFLNLVRFNWFYRDL